MLVAVILLAAAVGLIAMGALAAHSLAETYGGDWDIVSSVAAVVGLASSGIVLLARWVAQRDRPSATVTFATALVLSALVVIGGNLVGDARHVPPAEQSPDGA